MQALVTQTYELHEYPIPRLFIVLPKTQGLSGKVKGLISDQFRLYFLCECGSHTMSEDARAPHQIHLAKHEGYDLEKPTVFFERYGDYVLTLMHMIKYGITTAGIVVPPLANSKIVDGIDTAQKHLDFLKKNFAPLVDDTIKFLNDTNAKKEMGGELNANHTEFDQLEAIEGADLRQLESYLKVKDQGRVLGNLYRIVTSDGHVKWVCFDHYRASYRETAIRQLREIVRIHDGTYMEETGSIKIRLATNIQAGQFYDAMIKARWVQELDITFEWDATMDDLREFAKAVTKANVVSLTMDGSCLKGPALDVVNRTRRFDPIMKLASNARIQSLQIKGFDDFFTRVSKSSLMPSPKLRRLSVQSELPLEDKVKSINGIIKLYSELTALEVKLNHQYSITEAILDIVRDLPRLESLKVECRTLSVIASTVEGVIQDVTLMSNRLHELFNDFEAIQGNNCTRLLMMDTPQEHKDRPPSTLQTSNFSRIQITHEGKRVPTILAAPEWTIQDLMEMVTLEYPEKSARLLIDCERLSLSASVYRGMIGGISMTIKRLDRRSVDDLECFHRGHLTWLLMERIPRDVDKDRLIGVLRHNQALSRLEFRYEDEQDPAIDNTPEMTLLELVTVVTSNTSSDLESVSICYKRLFLTASVTFGNIRDAVMTTKQLSDLHSDDLAVIELGYVIRLEIGDIPLMTDEDRLTRILKVNIAHFHLQIGREGEHSTVNTELGMKPWGIIKMAASSVLCKVMSLKIDYWNLSIAVSVHEDKVQDVILAVDSLKDLVPDDLDITQWTTFSKLSIKYTPQEGDEDRLKTIITTKFSCIQFKHQGEQCLAILSARDRKLQDLMDMATSEPLEGLESFSIDCPRFSLTTDFSQGDSQNMAMTIERLDCLNSDDLAFIQRGYLSRLTINQALQEADKAQLIEIKSGSPSLKVSYIN